MSFIFVSTNTPWHVLYLHSVVHYSFDQLYAHCPPNMHFLKDSSTSIWKLTSIYWPDPNEHSKCEGHPGSLKDNLEVSLTVSLWTFTSPNPPVDSVGALFWSKQTEVFAIHGYQMLVQIKPENSSPHLE